jgi:hypothetical protein
MPGCADATIANGAIMSGIIVGVGYLLVFPFWMIRKLIRIETRLMQMRSDLKAQDDTVQAFDRRIEELDAGLEERRKEIIEVFQLKEDKPQ